MKLDFDNYRKQTVHCYDDIVTELNSNEPDMFLVKQSVSNLRKYIVLLTCLESEFDDYKSLDIEIKSLK